jgi:restriction system protein
MTRSGVIGLRVWVVRLGTEGEYADRCYDKGVAAIGWHEIGDITGIQEYRDLRKKIYESRRSDFKSEGGAGVAAGMIWNFIKNMNIGDAVLSPKKETRELLVGTVTGAHKYDKTAVSEDLPNIRPVQWLRFIPYDKVPNEIWRSMTAWQTLFELSSPEAVEATAALLKGLGSAGTGPSPEPPVPPEPPLNPPIEGERLFKDSYEKSLEILAAHFDTFSGIEFQQIVAGVLKAAGLYVRPIKIGPDQGIDIEAYRDPLQIGPPRILVQVKHRDGAVSGPEMREFLGAANRKDDVGLYISTGGFKPDAMKSAEKSDRLLRLMNWEGFVNLFLEVYDKLDNEIKAKVPIDSIKMLRNSEALEGEQ